MVSAIVAVVLIALVGGVALLSATVRPFGECRLESLAPDGDRAVSTVWDAEQLAHAGVIMSAGRDLGAPLRDQAIAVMTAMGESSLRNLDYGDWETSGVTNPDGSRTTSIGLFQQQDEWGTRDQRLDPYTAATLFYRAMAEAVPQPERETLEPTAIAHRTQINSDPDHYAKYWPAAVGVVERLSGADSGLVVDAADGCQADPPR